MYNIAKGNLEHVFNGDEPGRHTGELLGHSGVITALFFYKHMIYSGSMDCTVQVDAATDGDRPDRGLVPYLLQRNHSRLSRIARLVS